MDTDKIAELRNLPADELIEALATAALSADELAQLHKAEADEGEAARADVLAAIDALLVAQAPPAAGNGDENTPPPAAAEAEASATPGTDAPAWQAAGYAGPLDIAQMDWRRRNIKPADVPQTKAATRATSARSTRK